jgi:16S rRNA (guanine(966)-N(2))-methyltransferase RsmD
MRGRRVQCIVTDELRPTPDMVRSALFSILGDALPDRTFFDVFAGTGVIGIEAISRGARQTVFLERDFRLAQSIESHLRQFEVADKGQVLRADVYRWAERWLAPENPVNVYLSPPFADLQNRLTEFVALVQTLQGKIAPGSVLTIQVETGFPHQQLPDAAAWDFRQYGRNILLLWLKPLPQ